MPNWTYNRVRVRGDDSKTIQEVKELFEGENPFNALIPEPDWTVTPLSELHENNSSFRKKGESLENCLCSPTQMQKGGIVQNLPLLVNRMIDGMTGD